MKPRLRRLMAAVRGSGRRLAARQRVDRQPAAVPPAGRTVPTTSADVRAVPLAAGAWAAAWLGTWGSPAGIVAAAAVGVIVLAAAVINLAVERREFRPSIYGKIATATYIMTCVTIMWFNYLERTSILVQVAIYSSAFICVFSWIHYVLTIKFERA